MTNIAVRVKRLAEIRLIRSPKLRSPNARPPRTTVKLSQDRNVRSFAKKTFGSTLTGKAMRLPLAGSSTFVELLDIASRRKKQRKPESSNQIRTLLLGNHANDGQWVKTGKKASYPSWAWIIFEWLVATLVQINILCYWMTRCKVMEYFFSWSLACCSKYPRTKDGIVNITSINTPERTLVVCDPYLVLHGRCTGQQCHLHNGKQ